MFVVDEPGDEQAGPEFALVFHDLPRLASIDQALNGVSSAPMVDPFGSSELRAMRPTTRWATKSRLAHCINGACYPNTIRWS